LSLDDHFQDDKKKKKKRNKKINEEVKEAEECMPEIDQDEQMEGCADRFAVEF
jgi:hypothetical protein